MKNVIIVLNPEVRKLLAECDETVRILYLKLHGNYDDNIDPLHNPDYVKNWIKQEKFLWLETNERVRNLINSKIVSYEEFNVLEAEERREARSRI